MSEPHCDRRWNTAGEIEHHPPKEFLVGGERGV